MTRDFIDEIISIALEEDIGSGDITTSAIIAPDSSCLAKIIAREPLIVSGLEAARRAFLKVGPKTRWTAVKKEGDACKKNEIIAEIKGPTQDILTAERTALNFLGHLSGVATYTSLFVSKVKHTKAKILDTRKTIPGMRLLEKQAVKAGGGENHRFGLYDRYLIKASHITAAGSLTEAVNRIKKTKKSGTMLEVECKSIDEVKEALEAQGIDIIMLDNMTVEEVKNSLNVTQSRVKTEVSGNISLDNVVSYAETGVDFISIGALTHSAPSSDVSLTIRDI